MASFCAGFVDAIVGGGGLIQTPVALVLLPNLSVASIIGTLKIPAFSGTSFAAKQYLKKVKMNWKLLYTKHLEILLLIKENSLTTIFLNFSHLYRT